MARPKKLYEGENQEMSEEYPSVKQLVQGISLAATSGLRSATEVDKIVGSWVDRGYVLVDTHVLTKEPDYVQVLYVLAKLPVA